MNKRKKMIFIIPLAVIAISILAVWFFMQQPVFGKLPSGERLSRIEKSPNYKAGSFQNLTQTDVMLKDASFIKMIFEAFNRPASTAPPKILPSVKTNLKNIKADKPTIIWFGHSSYFIKSLETTVLVDPVFSGYASPVTFFGKSFEGSDVYNTNDFPDIDILIITHDHYDHLDYETIKKLIPKVKKVYTSLGVGSHLEYWGFKKENIIELDWWEMATISDKISITATPGRHFSGRSFTRGKSLWSSFVFKINDYNLFLGGDSGYEQHFKEIGNKYGPFDIAILETGQYGKNWPYIHMLPEETIDAVKDLNAKILLPVHWAKFILANHEWDEPVKRAIKSAAEKNVRITTPMIGEPVILDTSYPDKSWWEL